MAAASDGLAAFLEHDAFTPMQMPIWANATAELYTCDNAKTLLSRQVSSPVLWQKTVENMLRDGFDTFLEVGPGKVLAGLLARISKGARVLSVGDAAALDAVVTEVAHAKR
jgi:[acyl-carrier-protein] S-malonyltransferase